MRPIKIMFTAAFVMLWAILLAGMDTGNFEIAIYLAFAASAVFLAGLIDNGIKSPIRGDKLHQQICPGMISPRQSPYWPSKWALWAWLAARCWILWTMSATMC